MNTKIMYVLLIWLVVHSNAFAGGKYKYEVQEPNQLLVEVKGVVCSFCAYGTEKNLARLDFIDPNYFDGDGVFLDLENAAITLALQADQKVNLDHVNRAIKKGGYDLVTVYLKLVGTVEKQDKEFFIRNQWNGQLFGLLEKEGLPWKGDDYLGREVIIQGSITRASLENQVSSIAQVVEINKLETGQ